MDKMEHYFIESTPADYKEIFYSFGKHTFTFKTHSGIFSKDHVDKGTDILIRNIKNPVGKLLDLGCGYGIIGIALSKEFSLETTFSDVNKNAINLSKENAKINNVSGSFFHSNGFEKITEKFDIIALNPPIHVGKLIIYQLYEDSKNHLNENGRFIIVINEKHGAKSSLFKLKEIYKNVDIIYKKKGIMVIESSD